MKEYEVDPKPPEHEINKFQLANLEQLKQDVKIPAEGQKPGRKPQDNKNGD